MNFTIMVNGVNIIGGIFDELKEHSANCLHFQAKGYVKELLNRPSPEKPLNTITFIDRAIR